MISEYEKYGYYVDYKHWLKFSGAGARIAAYGVTCVAALGSLYTMYLLAIAILRKRRKIEPNEALKRDAAKGRRAP